MSLSGSRVALVGRRLEHNENLGLAHLRAALRREQAEVTTFYVNDANELEQAVRALTAAPPDVVGLSLADGGSAMLPLAVGEALAEAGYAGHVTAGGQFATLARQWLLERYAWLDSVVRFAGERPLVEIARRVRAHGSVDDIAGVTTRSGDGRPAPVLDATPLTLPPERDELPRILGHAAAHMAASRGCLGRCQYCGPAALHTLERREGVRAGHASSALTRAGVGGVRRRELDAVCDEMATLWHERDVRYFYFVDEHLLPYDELEAFEYLTLWKRGLFARGVGPLGIGTMLRADRITPKIARAFADLGLVRVFVGLELATAEEGQRFGRREPGQRELELLGTFAEHGVVTVSNLMLLNPYSTPATILAGIELLERIPHGVFEATRMMVYHGTRLMQTLAAEGRLNGNPLRYGYSFDDPVLERFAEIFTRLRAEVFFDYSVAFRTHDAFLALSLARRIHPERFERGVEERLERVRRAVNQSYADAYRRGLELALAGGGFAEAGALIARARPRVAALEVELDCIEARLCEATTATGRPFAPMRSAAAGVVSFALAACGGEGTRAGPPEHAPQPIGSSAPASPSSGPSATPRVVDAGPEEAELARFDAGPAAQAVEACAPVEAARSEQAVKSLLSRTVSCFSGWVDLSDPPRATSRTPYAPAGSASASCSPVPRADFELEARSALSGRVASCVDENGEPHRVTVEGGLTRERNEITQLIAGCGSRVGLTGRVRIVLDTKGRVTQVVASRPTPLTRCIHKVLKGLSFPCLSSFDVCPEHVIIE